MSIGIDYILRATTEGFTAGMAKANNAIEDTKKSLKGFGGASLVSTIGVAGVIAGFKAVLSTAQEVRDELEKMGKPVSAATASVARYGDAWDQVKKTLSEATVFSLSIFTRTGEAIGSFINRMRGITAEQEAQREQSARDADKLEKQLNEKLLERAQIEKKLAAEKKKTNDDAFTAFIKAEQNELDVINKTGAIRIKLGEQIKKDKYSELSLNDKIKSDRQDLEKVENQISKFKKDNLNSANDELEKSLLQTKAYELTHQIAVNTKKVEEERLTANKAITSELKSQLNAIAGIGGGGQFNEASDATLREVIRRNKAQAGTMTPSPGLQGIPQANELARLVLETKNAEKELKFRAGINLDFKRGGELGARQNFAGNPLNFDQIFSQLVKGQTVAEESNNTLKTIATNIRGIIKAQ
jgi:phage-related minor tail protein